MHESSKIFVEHARHVASAGSDKTIGLSKNGCSHSKKTGLTRGNKIEWSRSLGCGDFSKGLKRFRQSLLFTSSLKKTKEGSTRRMRKKMLEKDSAK